MKNHMKTNVYAEQFISEILEESLHNQLFLLLTTLQAQTMSFGIKFCARFPKVIFFLKEYLSEIRYLTMRMLIEVSI